MGPIQYHCSHDTTLLPPASDDAGHSKRAKFAPLPHTRCITEMKRPSTCCFMSFRSDGGYIEWVNGAPRGATMPVGTIVRLLWWFGVLGMMAALLGACGRAPER